MLPDAEFRKEVDSNRYKYLGAQQEFQWQDQLTDPREVYSACKEAL